MQTKMVLGGRGFSAKSKFLLERDQAQTLENFLVTEGTRKRRQQYSRWKYDRFASNAVRLIGTHKKSYVIVKDAINTGFNSFASGQSSTLEVRFRLPGLGGYSNKYPMYLASRQIHGIGYTFDLQLVQSGTNFDRYLATFIISDGSGTYTAAFTTLTTMYHGIWYTLSIVKDVAGGVFKAYLNGAFTEDVAFVGTPAGAQGTYGTTRTDPTFSDIVLGALNDLTTFSAVDIQEFRIWNEARSAGNISAYYNKKLSSTERTNLVCYVDFQNNHDGKEATELINTKNLIFFGGQVPFKDVNNYLVFDGSSMFGYLNPTGVGTTYNAWGGGGVATATSIFKVSEWAGKVCKLKECNIIGGLQLYYDGGNGKYGFRYKLINNGVTAYVSSGGMIETSDLNVTDFHVAIRYLYPSANSIEIWVNGVQKATLALIGVFTDVAGEVGRRVGGGPTAGIGFSCIKVKWFRTFNQLLPDTYFQTKYNQEVDDFLLTTFSMGTVQFDWINTAPTFRRMTGVGTNLPAVIYGSNDIYTFCTKENKDGYPGENYQSWFNLFTFATQIGEFIDRDDTGDPWANAGYPKIGHKQGYFVTSLQTRYNVDSWKTIKLAKSTHIYAAMPSNKLPGGYDRDRDPAVKMELYYYCAAASQNIENPPSFIGGDMIVSTMKKCRFLKQFRSLDGLTDVVIAIIGTGFYVFDRVTKVLTQYGVSIKPNEDKPFVSDNLNGEMYITDGITKLHVYVYKGALKVVKWGFERGAIPTPTGYVAAGPWPASELEYAYCYYNREIDQFGPLNFTEADGTGPRVVATGFRAIQLDGITPAVDFFEGATDVCIFRTKNLLGSGSYVGHYWLYDFLLGNSEGAMDWSQGDSLLSQRYPVELAQASTSMKPPDGDFLISHNKRIWVPDGDLFRYSRIGSELHAGIFKSETHTFGADARMTVSGGQVLTGAASFSDKILFVFTIGSMDMITGNDEFDFQIRRVHEGIGCVNHRTIVKYGETLVWLGLEDIYVFQEGIPRPYDQTGKISGYIKTHVDRTRLSETFAVLNHSKMLYELHVVRTDGIKVAIVLDLKRGEFSIFKDLNAAYGCEVLDSYDKPVVFYGTDCGFIISEDSSGMNFQPPSGSLRTTVTSYDAGTGVITTAASDLYVGEAGLIGNAVYVVSNQAATKGSVLRATITANTATTITGSAVDVEVAFGAGFVPANGDDVFIGPIFTKWRSPAYFNTAVQDNLLEAPEHASDLNGAELVAAQIIHNRGSSTGKAYLSVYRDGETDISKTIEITTLDKDLSHMHLVNSSKARFFEIELYHLHESAEFEFIGHGLSFNVGRDHYGTS